MDNNDPQDQDQKPVIVAITSDAIDELRSAILIESVARSASASAQQMSTMCLIVDRLNTWPEPARSELLDPLDYNYEDLREWALMWIDIHQFFLDRVARELDPNDPLAAKAGVPPEEIDETNVMREKMIADLKEFRETFALRTATPLGSDS